MDSSPLNDPCGPKTLKIALYRFHSGSKTSSQAYGAIDDNERNNNNNHHHLDTSVQLKYRRQNCGTCKGCASEDCHACGFCIARAAATKRRRCVRKTCRRPSLPKHARCSVCRSKLVPSSMGVASFPETHSQLAECGLCGKVVHPACLIRKYNLATDARCVFYHKLLNAWDCILCKLGVEENDSVRSSSTESSSPSFSSSSSPSSTSPKNLRTATEGAIDGQTVVTRTSIDLRKPVVVIGARERALAETENAEKKCAITGNKRALTDDDDDDDHYDHDDHDNIDNIDDKPCEFCAQTDLSDYLMTCTRCARRLHDVCAYVRHRSDPRFARLSGVKNCLNPKFWECPSCLWGRGVRNDDDQMGVTNDSTATTRIVEKTIDMFSPQTGNIIVSHFTIHIEEAALGEDILVHLPTNGVGGPDEVECFMDDRDPELALVDTKGGEGGGGVVLEGKGRVDGGGVVARARDVSFVDQKPLGSVEPLNVLNLLPVASIKCEYCSRFDFTSEEALNSHVTTQHPKCGHCPQELHFQDIPKILSHFKAEHKNLKRCKVLIANETLILAMNTSFHG